MLIAKRHIVGVFQNPLAQLFTEYPLKCNNLLRIIPGHMPDGSASGFESGAYAPYILVLAIVKIAVFLPIRRKKRGGRIKMQRI